MKNSVSIGPTPAEEDCEQLGIGYDPVFAKHQVRVFIRQLRREFGDEPEGARLKVSSESHDFGIYYEAACQFNPEIEESIDYAFNCENCSSHWDEISLEELRNFKKQAA